MLIPVRCFSCGKVIGHLWESYQERVNKGEQPKKVMKSLGIERYCCRRMIISHRDYIDDIIKYRGR